MTDNMFRALPIWTEPKDSNFNYKTLDSHNEPADMTLLNSRWKHSGTGKTYEVVAHVWIGQTDEWGYIMCDITDNDGVGIVRPKNHFDGLRSNGQKRYERV